MCAKRSCCDRAPLERNLEAAVGDRTEAAALLVNARCMLTDLKNNREIKQGRTKENRQKGINSAKNTQVRRKKKVDVCRGEGRVEMYLKAQKKIGVAGQPQVRRQTGRARPQLV